MSKTFLCSGLGENFGVGLRDHGMEEWEKSANNSVAEFSGKGEQLFCFNLFGSLYVDGNALNERHLV